MPSMRHVRETASALLTEEKVVGYIDALHSLWTEEAVEQSQAADGPKVPQQLSKATKSPQRCTKEKTTTSATQNRTHKQILETRLEAREAMLRSLPDLLGKLVGQQNAVRGAQRLFVVLQHHALNKNLFYNLLEELLQELFPDLRQRLEKIKTKAGH
ncbi:Sorting nexin C-terminal [Trinorchestia longiramus]|nr:Sorting nexin C-terminal [Trinorchestia longiramus]